MEALIPLLVMTVIALIIAGPVAMVLSIVLFNKLGNMQRRLDKLEGRSMPGVDYHTPPVTKPEAPQKQPPSPQPQETVPGFISMTPPEPPPLISQQESKPPQPVSVEASPKTMPEESKEVAAVLDTIPPVEKKPPESESIELTIGIRVLLIAGIVTVIFGVGFFLKHIYETMTFGPVARVSLVAVGGLIALIIGEVLRRIDFGIVAKGITALGFALFYAAVFSGSRVYALFSVEIAFVLSIVVTAGAMAYAVGLNEVLIALLALLGGYLAPIIIASGQNLPMPLFSYVLVLSLGAVGCAMFRRWRAVNWVAIVGTYLLYTTWFEQFYYDGQMAIALGWLGVFGGIYLTIPVLHGLIRKLSARVEDVAIIAANSAAVFYHLWRILYPGNQKALALASVTLGVIHLLLMFVVLRRCREDKKLQAALGVLGTAFISAALPLYLELQAALIGWAVEAVVLAFISIQYRNQWTKALSILAAAVSTAGLFYHLPLHDSGAFKPFLNQPFGTWMFVAVAVMACHALWRFLPSAEKDETGPYLSQIYFVWGLLLIGVGVLLEWYDRCDWFIEYLNEGQAKFSMGAVIVAAILMLGYLLRPVCPRGSIVQTAGFFVAICGAVFTAVVVKELYYEPFVIFANAQFAVTIGFVAAMLFAAWRIWRDPADTEEQLNMAATLALSALLLLWILLSEQVFYYWYCIDAFGTEKIDNWKVSAQMYMSVMWAAYGAILLIVGFIARARNVRYLSLVVFAVLLGKIFIIDTATLRTEYRITAFITTGLVLVGGSFLYQMLKKKGFFDTLEKQLINTEDDK